MSTKLSLTEPMVLVTCPDCNGSGRRRLIDLLDSGEPTGAHGKPIPCPTCRGSKFVPGLALGPTPPPPSPYYEPRP